MTGKLIEILSHTMGANLPLTIATSNQFPWLSLIVLLPVIGALFMPLLPKEEKGNKHLARNFAISFLLIDFVLIAGVLAIFFNNKSHTLQLVERFN